MPIRQHVIRKMTTKVPRCERLAIKRLIRKSDRDRVPLKSLGSLNV
jgi:hypothetical protein